MFLSEHGWSSRVEIAKALNMNRSTVKRFVDEYGAYLIEDDGALTPRIRMRYEDVPVLGIDIGAHHWRLTTRAFSEEHITESPRGGDVDARERPGETFDAIVAAVQDLNLGDEGVAGVVIGVPFAVRDDQRLRATGNWRGVTIKRELVSRLGLGTPRQWLESDVNLGAIAELEAAKERHDVEDGRRRITLIYTKWSSSLVGSVVVANELRNASGWGGSFVHAPIVADTDVEPCPICDRPCTAAAAALNRIFEKVPGVGDGDTEERAQALYELVKSGDPEATELLTKAARCVGYCLGHAANALVPYNIVLGGAFKGDAADWVREKIEDGFQEIAAPAVVQRAEVEQGTHTGRAAVFGAGIRAFQKFGPDYIWKKHQAM